MAAAFLHRGKRGGHRFHELHRRRARLLVPPGEAETDVGKARCLRRRWQRDVRGATVYNSSLVRLSVYSTTPEDTAALGAAVTQALATRGWEYVGGDVAIKIVNPALVSRFVARPNLPANAAAGFGAGAALAVLTMSRRRRRHLFSAG